MGRATSNRQHFGGKRLKGSYAVQRLSTNGQQMASKRTGGPDEYGAKLPLSACLFIRRRQRDVSSLVTGATYFFAETSPKSVRLVDED
jgi:hypothetical protein